MATIIDTCDNGVVVRQITENEGLVSNIYCERPYVSPDNRRFLYARRVGEEWEFVLCEFGSWRKEVVGRGALGSAISYQGDYYYSRKATGGGLEFVRIDLNTGASEVRFEVADGSRGAGHPTVSPDGRYLAFHRALSFDPQRFGIFLVDRESGACEVLHEDPFVCNAHSQFDAGSGRTLLIQHNRGCEYRADGTRVKLVGEEGATLFLLDVPSGAVTRLPIGKPYTPRLTGHEAWVGTSDDIIFTVNHGDSFDETRGNILFIRPGEDYRQYVPGVTMNHIGTTPCGRYFHGDGGEGGRIIVGSPRTGRWVEICLSRTNHRREFGQQGHPHAALSPDFQWVVFNSDRTGQPETYVVSVPAGLLEGLD